MDAKDMELLTELAARLSQEGLKVSLRGDGDASFLYILGASNCAEASLDSGRIWVEFWGSLDENESAVSEATFDRVEEAARALLGHLM